MVCVCFSLILWQCTLHWPSWLTLEDSVEFLHYVCRSASNMYLNFSLEFVVEAMLFQNSNAILICYLVCLYIDNCVEEWSFPLRHSFLAWKGHKSGN
jgi:hypothetical protein